MADLSRDRGQILIIGAVTIAIALVALSGILNSGVYVENLANRESTLVGDEGPVVYQSDLRRNVGRAVVEANDRGTTLAEREDNVSRIVDLYGESVGTYEARSGRVTNLTVTNQFVGRQVVRTTDGNFTEVNGSEADDANWSLATNRRVRSFSMDVQRTTLADPASVFDAFHVNVTDDDGDVWEIFVRESASATVVRVETPGGTLSPPCTDASGSRTVIDVTAATVAGEHCEGLDFFNTLGGTAGANPPYTVGFTNADDLAGNNVEGRYRLVAKGGPLAPDYGFTGDDVESRPVVYSVDVLTVYGATDATYNATIRVAPGEPDV